MPVTLSIKHVPDGVAEGLRRRAAGNRRSLQQELLMLVEQAAMPSSFSGVADPPAAYGHSDRADPPAGKGKVGAGRGRRLTLDELWERARKLGLPHGESSAAIVRRDRDARNRR